MQGANPAAGQAGAQQINLAALQASGMLPPGAQLVRLPNGQIAIATMQQIAFLQQQAQAQAQAQLLAGGGMAAAGAPQANAQLSAVSAIQQRLQATPGAAAGGAGAAARQPQAAATQAALLAAARAVPAGPPVKLTNNFTDDQLATLKEQILLFKNIKKNISPSTPQDLERCKPKPLPPQLLPPPPVPQVQLQPAAVAAAAAAAAAARPAVPAPNALALQQQQQQLRPQSAGALGQQQQQQRGPGRPPAAGRPGQQRDGTGQQQPQQPEAPLGPTTPPMEVPVRRYAGPLLGMLPPPEVQSNSGAPPSLNVDVPRMLLKEYHHRIQRAKVRRQHELEQLLARKDLPVGHGRGPNGLPGRAAVVLELRKLKLWNVQLKIRGMLEREQEEIMNLQDRNYRQLQKNAAKYKQTLDLTVQQKQHEKWEKLISERLLYKKTTADRFIMFRDMHLARNKQLAKFHERWARDLNRQRMDDNDRRLEALKANDFEAYKELLRQTYGPSTDDERFAEVERFLTETEEYINKLTKKLVQYKAEEQAGEAVQEAIAEARMLELSEEEVKIRAEAAQQQHMATNELLTQVHTLAGDAQTRFTQLAHNIREKVTRQPAYLKPPKAGKLREYQMVGLEWMVSLYNNKLNGILADEMGLGKTVQVMALLAYLYEFKQNYGPHLIIVPNAVIVNWKAELQTWLPDFRCIYYTGSKDERAAKFQQDVQSMQFNILVTTYETIMRDRAKLSKLEWKYIIIDEAQRMKDRESKLSQDLNKFTTARRLLLTGTPLQNELKELWSLLNLLLPDVFNDSNTFSEWFTRFLGVDSFGSDAPGGGDKGGEAAALDREKKILVVNRLHQILSPFMLRRMVKDVEQQLPEKVTITLKCPMSAYQTAIYNWIKTTNTIRVDPQHRRATHGNRAWEPLQNKVMELRKVCNHPQLCYQRSEHFWSENVVRTCGKMFWLDRMLVKLHASGHRVLLFSTMTKMLDTVEFYLSWRQVDALDGSGRKVLMQRRRIDGSTTLEERERAIQEFNRPNTDVFIFLLSIRAAGRGLNLQSADTVVIYDPDPNPKNEEQAIARSHRIGQTKEVRVFHLEAIADPADSFPPPHYQPRRGDMGSAGGGAPLQQQQQQQPAKFADSIESLMRNIIQKQKIDMANEVIDAGRFDMQTTNEERRKTLEEMLLDEDRLQTATNEAPTLESFNRQLARTSAEFELFQRMDAELEWPGELFAPHEVPDYLAYSAREARDVLTITDRRPGKVGMLATAERRAQEAGGRGRGRGSKPPRQARATPQTAVQRELHDLRMQQQQMMLMSAPAALTYADLAGGSSGAAAAGASERSAGGRPSQSLASFPGGGVSGLSGLGDEGEGEEEVAGGGGSAFEELEEEVLDEDNIDTEFEQVLEQQEGGAAGAGASTGGTGGGTGAGAAAGRGGSTTPSSLTPVKQQQQEAAPGSAGRAAAVVQQQQLDGLAAGAGWQQQQEQHAAAAAAAAAPAVWAAGGFGCTQQLSQQQQQEAAVDAQDDWEDVQPPPQQQQQQQPGHGGYDAAAAGAKRSWGDMAAAGSGGAAAGGVSWGAARPSLSGPGTTSSAGMPSSSQGGAKKIRLKMKGLGGGAEPPPAGQ